MAVFTGLIAKFLGSTARKAVVSGTNGTITAVIAAIGGPEVVAAFQNGIAEGVMPAAHQLGVVIGTGLALGVVFILNHLPTWIVANKANKPE